MGSVTTTYCMSADNINSSISETLASLLALMAANDKNLTTLSDDIISDACSQFDRFTQQSSSVGTSKGLTTLHAFRDDTDFQLAHHAVAAAQLLRDISTTVSPSQKKQKKHTWQALQSAADRLCTGSKLQETNALMASLVFGALALMQCSHQVKDGTKSVPEDNDAANTSEETLDSVKAAASALSVRKLPSTIQLLSCVLGRF